MLKQFISCKKTENNQILGNGIPRFANYFQDHMVLQRAPLKAIVWGYGDSSQLTTLRINNQI